MDKKDSQAKSAVVIQITTQDLPLCCPRPGAALWAQHPRVYLAINEKEAVTCPYCGTHYQLLSND